MAGERSFFFDGEDKLYNSNDFAQLFDMFFGTGVVKGYSDELSMGPLSNGMKVVINKGCAVICGRGYIIDGVKIFTHEPAHTTLDRIDRIVLQLNLATRAINLTIKKGAIADVPVPPTLQQDNMNNGGIIYELPIAQVRIIKGKSFIESTQITDERTFCDLQGQTGLYAKKQLTGKFLPDYLNYWSDLKKDDYRNPLRYWVDGYGIYHVEGSCGNGVYGANKDICKFPVGPPKAQSVFAWGSDGKVQFLYLHPDGSLRFTSVFSETSTVIIPEFSFRPSGL
ncbi:structural protein [Bacillus proteolyticus]|uniref:Structural protein n=1 Tax=Bacillus proteolyticus TaxID=2026192 RepID=A0AA44KVL6_9BACI|nr:structural protein [Bacillus proteolyticus]OJE45033.1 structural protein [Bacillus proteolyticus]